MAMCERCWADAKAAQRLRGVDQFDEYRRLVAERECSPEQQCGEMHLLLDYTDGSRRCRCGKVVKRVAESQVDD